MRAEIGIIGGSGFYTFLDNAKSVVVATPFGAPSAPLAVGEVAGRPVAFIPRHGQRHEIPPHRVNYRANLWALRSVGVRQVLAPSAVGSLKPELTPGSFLVPDQLVDRTWGRAHTVYDQVGKVVHVPFADPYCPRGREAVLASAAANTRMRRVSASSLGGPSRLSAVDQHRDERSEDHTPVVDGGTLVVINGPRFSTRAESRWHAAAGWSVVGMTGAPEAAIARELAMCLTPTCLVTDADAGVEVGEGVTHAEVLRVFAASIDRLKDLMRRTIAALPPTEPDETATCSCRRVLDGLELPFSLP